VIKKNKAQYRQRIKQRIRKKVLGTQERPRLTVYRSHHHIYAQIVDDTMGKVLVSSSTLSKSLRDQLAAVKSRQERAKLVGADAGKRALALKIQSVVFDRNGYRYHGNIKALADGAREVGLKF
jgi:large subunit ribosomal protein L18